MQTLVYTPSMQGTGEFDGGKIKEQKPIGFPGEGSVVKRVGPLFYWAWATSEEEASIGLHPHQGYEILTYVVQGFARHGDTLGTDSTVGAGGVQVMQTGSGVSHQEKVGAGTEMFQIWFEPEWGPAMRRAPTYRQFGQEHFSRQVGTGYTATTVIGEGSPVELVVDAKMWDVEIDGGASYRQLIPAGYTLTALAIRGEGLWAAAGEGASKEPCPFRHKDFIVCAADSEMEATVGNTAADKQRLLLIQVPTKVSYTLYPKR